MRLLGILLVVASLAPVASAAPSYAERVDDRAAPPLPLAGRTVVLDPGHQLGNRNFPGRVSQPVPDGRGGRKPCNTTGTSTNGGYPEATFAWQTTRVLRARLERLGATVRLTRDVNSDGRWGPCVDTRGRAGNRARADVFLSIHADGNLARGARGFHVAHAPDRTGADARLARITRTALRRQGIPVSTYVGGGTGLSVRTDLATLNFSRVPTVLVELGNMRDRRDAHRMTTARGRAAYAAALATAVRRYL